MNRAAAEARGRTAETRACWMLRLKGWRILARRARVPGGEVDIVARRGKVLAFIEVKARSSDDAAGLALDRHRLKRVAAAAERLAPRFARPDDAWRIDAVFVLPGRWPRHQPNVWQG